MFARGNFAESGEYLVCSWFGLCAFLKKIKSQLILLADSSSPRVRATESA